ncbi:MAG TPA: class C sortase [Candidatus Mediterraneibacter norwichensis]|nr:class C sortase [Candidatus Mediterraneibacter norwichensis]
MFRKIIKAAAILLFLAGACILIYPWVGRIYGNWLNERQIREFQNMRETAGDPQSSDSSDEEEKSDKYPYLEQGGFAELRQDMETYNRRIYENGQQGLRDAWDFEQEIFPLDEYDLDTEVIGYIESEAMDICLPLYIGTSSEHLAEGAAVLSQTSMPTGGENTNCVIAGHRGWRGIPMFQNIEALQEGDIIWITNLWERLAYRVVRTTVITPDDIGAVRIVNGQDMLTLITCHPYTKNYQRYVVYCVRTHDAVYHGTDREGTTAEDQELNRFLAGRQKEQPEFVSSEEQIEREKIISRAGLAGAVILIGILAAAAVMSSRGKRKKRKKRQAGEGKT